MPTTLFPLASRGVPPDVEIAHVAAALHEQQEGHPTAARYFLEVPISGADVERWGTSLSNTLKSVSVKEEMDNEEVKTNMSSSAAGGLLFPGASGSDVPFFLPSEILAMNSLALRRAAVHPGAPLPAFQWSGSGSTRSMSKVLQHRRKWLSYRQRIPLHQRRMEFLDVLSHHALVTLVGSAGSGRTLQLPQILSETEALKRSRILLVAPNEAAARMIVLRLREERGELQEGLQLNGGRDASSVGCVLSMYMDACHHHSILVITADVLLRQLLCDPTLLDVSVVIIDDIHWRSERTELCLALLKDLLLAQKEANIREEKPRVPSLGSSLHVIVNCPDSESAKQIHEFFSGSVPLTSFDLGSVEAHPVSGSVVDPVIFYVDETVQWISKCVTEQKSTLCRSPEDELQPYVSKVEVVTQILTASEADFFDENKCRQYWCGLMLDTLTHFDDADRKTSSCDGTPLSVVVVVVPELEKSINIIQDELQKYGSRIQLENSKGADEGHGASKTGSHFVVHNLFEKDDVDLADKLFFSLLPSIRNSCTGGDNTVRTRHILLGSETLLETLLPPSVNVGLVIDFARTSTCMFDIETAADTWVTEYASATQLKYRRRMAKRLPFLTGSAQGNSPPLVVQLIPKTLLHSAARRRLTADAGHHAVFRLSSSQYLQLFQVLQLREDIRIAAAERGAKSSVFNSTNTPNAGMTTTISSKISSIIPQYFMGVPASTSNKYEQSRRVFQQMEIFLRASGHVRIPKKSPPVANDSCVAFLQPLGILTCLWLFPLAISRVLIFGVLLQRPLESTAVAAIWLAGDPFLAYLKSKENSTNHSDEDELETEAAISYEARKFFARDHSDIASLFYLYKMWVDQRQGGEEQEAEFLAECKVDRRTLERTLQYHVQLMMFLYRTGAVENSFTDAGNSTEEIETALTKNLVALRDHAFMDEIVQATISSAVYPHCAVPHGSGAVKLYEGMSAGGSARVHRVGVFAKTSVMRDTDTLHSVQSAPVVYLTRLSTNSQNHRHQSVSSLHSLSLPVLEQNMLLHQAASVIFCGEEKEVPREAPRRCRGWSSAVSTAWRKTRRARVLPPSAEVPPVSIPLQPFDVIESKQVVVVVDGQLQYLMRSTTAQWLRQLRQYIHCSLQALVALPQTERDPLQMSGTAVSRLNWARNFTLMGKEVAEAWQWWDRRREGGVEWLREERWKYNNALLKAKQEEGSPIIRKALRLYPFFAFQTFPGPLVPVQLPEKRSDAISAVAPVNRGGSEEDALQTGEDTSIPDVYTGKLPSADVDQIIRTCVESIAEAESRKAESKLLKDNPESFSFLDPANELHEYYLYLLRQQAPNIEVLGDDIDGLIAFLKELESDLREELNLPPLQEEMQGFQAAGDTDADPNTISIEEVTANEAEDALNPYQYGVQEEEAVSFVKKVPRAIPPSPSAQLNRHQGGGVLGAGNAETPISHGKQNSNSHTNSALTGTSFPETVAQDPTEAPGSTNEEPLPSHLPVNPNELLSLVEHGGPSTNISMDTRPSAAELAALLGEGGGDDSTLHSKQEEESTPASNPLSRPPPPLPADLLEHNPPSVVVYPIPIPYPQNIHHDLARALGETLGMRVGPTHIVGKIARIMLPNPKVERRCLELGSYTCFGKRVYIFKNDRIVDNPIHLAREANSMLPIPIQSAIPMHSMNGMGGGVMEGMPLPLPPPPPGMLPHMGGMVGMRNQHMMPGGGMLPPYGIGMVVPPPPRPPFYSGGGGRGGRGGEMPHPYPGAPPPMFFDKPHHNNNPQYHHPPGNYMDDPRDVSYKAPPQEWTPRELDSNFALGEQEEVLQNTGEPVTKDIGVLSDSDDDNSSWSSSKSNGSNNN